MKKTLLILLVASVFGIKYCNAQTDPSEPRETDYQIPPPTPPPPPTDPIVPVHSGAETGPTPDPPPPPPPPTPTPSPTPGDPSPTGPDHIIPVDQNGNPYPGGFSLNIFIPVSRVDLKLKKDKARVETLNIP